MESLDDLLKDPGILKNVSPKELFEYLNKEGYNPVPLSKSSTISGVPFEKGGGFKINWGKDRILQYHPGSKYHGAVPYYKISSGTTGTLRFDMNGNLLK